MVSIKPAPKEHLRTEIGVFIEQIFLRILESGNSTYHHKNRVLQVLYDPCSIHLFSFRWEQTSNSTSTNNAAIIIALLFQMGWIPAENT